MASVAPLLPPEPRPRIELCPLETHDINIGSIPLSNDSGTSGFGSYFTSMCSDNPVYSDPPSHIVTTSEPQMISRRCSSGQKLAKFIHALTPCRGRLARRSHSFGSATFDPNIRYNFDKNCKKSFQTAKTDATMSTATFTGSNQSERKSSHINISKLACSSWSAKLNVLTTAPTMEMYEFRRLWPSSFVTLVTNYLGFLTFTSEDIEQIRDSLTKECKQCALTERCNSCETTSPAVSQPTTPRKIAWSKDLKNSDKEVEHWLVVVNTVLLYLLEDQRYKHRFIMRRPGSHASMNELERILFPPKHRPLSVSLKNRIIDQPVEDRLHQPALPSDILEILKRYDSSVIACLLARVLRRHGAGLLPVHLRQLFVQLVDSTKENESHQLRAVRLLFQLLPRRLLHSVFHPLFELLASIAAEPECEVDETSLAVLFFPVFFLDRATTTPTALANPVPLRAVELLVRLARRELDKHQSVLSLFHVPTLFHEDCVQNYNSHFNQDNPPLSCSLRYCANMTPSPRSKQIDQPSDTLGCRTAVPKVNLTSTFMAKRPRHLSPFAPTECPMPALKSFLISPPLDFRVRRTSNNILRSQFTQHSHSPLSVDSTLSKWSS